MAKSYYKTVWLSDIHLGSKDCKAEYLLSFLKHAEIETLYLVGDIVDMWAMSKSFRWPQSHNDVLHQLLKLSKGNTKVVYLPGNHDAPLQQYDGLQFGEIEVVREKLHVTAKGQKLLVLHGDQFDGELALGKVTATIGDFGYDLLLFLDRCFHKLRGKHSPEYWSLARYIKSHVKGAKKAIERYREVCCNAARERGYDGVVCGHIHHPEISTFENTLYFNDGDWVESCSALVEDRHGEIKLVFWPFADIHSQPPVIGELINNKNKVA